MEIIHAGEGFDNLDEETHDRLVALNREILACECDGAPFCGHPEERFLRYVLELRSEGHDPEDIVTAMGAEYHLEAYPGDILSFLDESVRLLDAIESLASVANADGMRSRTRQRRETLERHR